MGYVGRDGPNGPVLIRGSYGHGFVDECTPQHGEPVIDKAAFSAFFQTDLDQHLQARSIASLILLGVTTDCCVHSTLRDPIERDLHCVTIEDAREATRPELHEAALAIIHASGGVFGQTTTTERMLRAFADLTPE
jgi:nicotinamidase-related amidase